ncbi:MAG: SpaA isopeptide-forming pilin-related protein [Caldilineaceae bacterium]
MPTKLTHRTSFILVVTLLLFSVSSSAVLQASRALAQTTPSDPVQAGAGFNVIFAQGTSDSYVHQTYAAMRVNPALSPFRTGAHWNPALTALGTGGSGQGDAVALTWSIIPDGTLMPSQEPGDATCNSDLIARMNATYGNGPWQAEIAAVFAEWSTHTGNTYTQVSDDGAAWPNSPGVTGLRGDLRIGGCSIDGNSNILAYNFFPSNGDMKIDADDNFYTASILHTGFHNVIAHEHGHGDGLEHVCPVNQTKLMEPFVSFAFTGLQHDDIRGGQRQYGDFNEVVGNPNDSAAAATNLGTPTVGTPVNMNGVSIDDNNDQDWFKFTVGAGAQLNASVSPVGSTYLEGPQNSDGSCTAGTNLNSLAIHNLDFEVRDSDGTTVLASGNTHGVGLAETLNNIALGAAGTKYIRVFGDTTDNIQLYNLQLTVNTAAATGTIIIRKATSPAGGTGFGFTSNVSGNTSFTLNDGQNKTIASVPVGSYTVSENNPSGYSLTNLVCTDPTNNTTVNVGTRTATINLAANETVDCTFTNTQTPPSTGTIIIRKATSPAGGTGFGFTSNVSGNASFTLNDGQNKTIASVPVGSYTVSENNPSGYSLTNLVCTDPDNGSTVNVGTRTATIDLDSGETVDCTFTNTQTPPSTGTIIIRKATSPAGGTGFGFTSNVSGNTSFTLNDGQNKTIASVPVGSYTVSENNPSGYSLTNLVCTDPDNGSTVNVGTRTATIDLDSGETVDCTFTNTQTPPSTGTIIIRKATSPAGGTGFGFTSNVSGNASFTLNHGQNKTITSVPVGAYTVSENNPSGYSLTNLVCTDPTNDTTVNVGARTATINLAANETVDCTFTNTASQKKVTINVYKYNDRNGNGKRDQGETYLSGWKIRLYNAQGSQIDTEKTAGSTGLAKFNNLPAGNYTVCEDQRSGWSNTQPGSTNPAFGNRPCYTLSINGGQTAKVYFGNRKINSVVAAQAEDEPLVVDEKVIPTAPANPDGVIIVTTPDDPVEEDNPDASTSGTTLYLPLINKE